MSVHPYTQGDMLLLTDLVGMGEPELLECDEMVRSFGDDLAVARYVRTLKLEDRPVACFGVWPITDSRGGAWTVLTRQALGHPKMLYSAVKGELDRFQDEFGMARIEAVGRVTNPALGSWFRHLGFARETADLGMANYAGDGEAYHLYARVRNG